MAPLHTLRPVTSLTTTLTRLSLNHQPSPASCIRSFSTTSPLATKTVPPTRLPSKLIPPYPYGPRLLYKQSNSGLYGSARIRFGNIVSERRNKARRHWRPNVHVKSFYLPDVGANVRTRLTLRVLKTIRKEGGITNYLLKSKPQRIKDLGPGGWNLRWLLMQTKGVQERLNAERRELGLPEKPVVDRSEMIHYALDRATPGPLSRRGKAALASLKGEDVLGETFALGEEALHDVEGVEELSDEAEAILLQELDAAKDVTEGTDGVLKVKTEKQGLES